jgi:hypothetical protein
MQAIKQNARQQQQHIADIEMAKASGFTIRDFCCCELLPIVLPSLTVGELVIEGAAEGLSVSGDDEGLATKPDPVGVTDD